MEAGEGAEAVAAGGNKLERDRVRTCNTCFFVGSEGLAPQRLVLAGAQRMKAAVGAELEGDQAGGGAGRGGASRGRHRRVPGSGSWWQGVWML